MIVWGGQDAVGPSGTGGRYDPTGDTWLTTSTGANAPSGRSSHSGVWTGTEMIIWGGQNGGGDEVTGGKYNPISDTWVATPVDADTPLARAQHTAIWTGSEILIFGGVEQTFFNFVSNGAGYLP